MAGKADLVATGIPLDTGATGGDGAGRHSRQDRMRSPPCCRTRTSHSATPSCALRGPLNLLGVQVGIVVGLEPSVQDGQLVLTPTSVEVNGTRSSAEELRARFGAVADTVLQPRTVCVARWLPRDLTLTGAEVTPGRLTLSLRAI